MGYPTLRFKHTFAKLYLEARRVEVFADNSRILQYSNQRIPDYPMQKITTAIQIGDTITSDDLVVELSYPELMRMGYCIVPFTPRQSWFPAQRVGYKLAKFQEGMPHHGEIPKRGSGGDHYVIYSPAKRAIQLVGNKADPSGYGPIIYLDAQPKKDESTIVPRNINKYFDSKVSTFDHQMLRRIKSLDDKPKFVGINELPVIFSVDTNEIVCIPIDVDIPKIGCVGKTGSGKTYCAHMILDHIKWKTNHDIAILNDNSNQTHMWTLPNQSFTQAKYLEKIGEEPRPLPIVPLYPTSQDLTDNDILLREELSQKISMDFADVVNNFDYFFQGREQWKLGASDKWFRQCKDRIMEEAKNIDDIEDILVQEIGHIKGLKPTIGKIVSIFRDMFDMNFTNISSGIPAKWRIVDHLNNEEFEANPVDSLMRVGCIPSVITTNLGRKEYYPNYMRYYMDSIYDGQIKRGKPAWMMLDEVGNIYKKGNKKTVAAESFIKCCTEGRIRQLGVLYTIQNYSKLDEEVRNNTNYLISCVYSDAKEINLIGKDFDLDSKRMKQLSSLKQHEVIIMSNDKPLVIYGFDGERREETGVAYKGFTIPCLSEHRRPGEQI